MASPRPARVRPPGSLGLEDARRSFVVPLADAMLNVDEDWCRFVADVWEACSSPGSRHRCIPVQMDESAWPLDERLREVNFVRGFGKADRVERDAYVVRRLLIEMCRHLGGQEAGVPEEKAPVTLFLSHAKADLNREPKVAEVLMQHLKEDQPVEAWVDSGDIESGSKFSEAIAKGVRRGTVLVVLTDQYATREWCRREVLLAKAHQRPVAVVNALVKHDARSFPYLGNVPVLRWDGSPERAIDLALKETLHHLHAQRVLEGSCEPGETVFVRAPELVTLVGLPPGSRVLYPDPPVGDEESALLAKTGVVFGTPLQRWARAKSLGGSRLALSMSESTDIRSRGWDLAHLERVMLEISRYLLVQGATLAYGGHLGSEGYTQRLFELVRTHNGRSGVEPYQRIVNYVGWPLPRPTRAQESALKWVATLEPLSRPLDVDESLDPEFVAEPTSLDAEKSAKHRFAWARGMTEMRRYQADVARSGVVARIVLGGSVGPTIKTGVEGSSKPSWYKGRIPGVLEEVVASVEKGQPVFVIGAFGGAARLVADLLRGVDREEATWEYQKRAPHAVAMRDLYAARGLPWLDYPDLVAMLRARGIAGINPFLSESEHRELFEVADTTRLVEVLLTGLARLKSGTPV